MIGPAALPLKPFEALLFVGLRMRVEGGGEGGDSGRRGLQEGGW